MTKSEKSSLPCEIPPLLTLPLLRQSCVLVFIFLFQNYPKQEFSSPNYSHSLADRLVVHKVQNFMIKNSIVSEKRKIFLWKLTAVNYRRRSWGRQRCQHSRNRLKLEASKRMDNDEPALLAYHPDWKQEGLGKWPLSGLKLGSTWSSLFEYSLDLPWIIVKCYIINTSVSSCFLILWSAHFPKK